MNLKKGMTKRQYILCENELKEGDYKTTIYKKLIYKNYIKDLGNIM